MAQLKAPFVTTQATRDSDGIPSGTGETYLYVVTTSRYFLKESPPGQLRHTLQTYVQLR